MSDLTLREQIAREYTEQVYTEAEKVLRDATLAAMLKATSLGDVSEAVRNQRIGQAQGLAEALDILRETSRRMFNED